MSYHNALTARIGVHAVGRIVAEDLEWIFREQPVDDYGIDAHMEVCLKGKPTGRLIAAQIKSGESWFSSKRDNGFVYSGTLRHLEYWTLHSLPVILILYNPVLRGAWWVPIESERIDLVKGGWKIVIPYTSNFDRNASEMLSPLALPDYRKRKKLQVITTQFSHKAALSTGVSGLLDALQRAETCIDLVFPYLDSALYWVVKTISHRVRVRLIISPIMTDDVEHEIFRWVDESPGLEVRIWESQGQLHAKYLVMDNELAVYGSTNLTQRSWREGREIVLAADDPTVVSQLSEQFEQLWINSIGIAQIIQARIRNTDHVV